MRRVFDGRLPITGALGSAFKMVGIGKSFRNVLGLLLGDSSLGWFDGGTELEGRVCVQIADQ